MHSVTSCANDVQHTENNDRVKSANHHLSRFFLSASAWSSLSSLMTSLLMWWSSHLHGKHCLMTSLLMWWSSHLHGKHCLMTSLLMWWSSHLHEKHCLMTSLLMWWSSHLHGKHCLMTSLLMWWSSHLHGKLFISYHSKTTSTCTFQFQNMSSHYVVWYQVIQSCTYKEYLKTYNSWLFPHITIQPLRQF